MSSRNSSGRLRGFVSPPGTTCPERLDTPATPNAGGICSPNHPCAVRDSPTVIGVLRIRGLTYDWPCRCGSNSCAASSVLVLAQSPMPSRGPENPSDNAPDLGQQTEAGMSIHRYDKESGKVMEQVSLPDVCLEVRPISGEEAGGIHNHALCS